MLFPWIFIVISWFSGSKINIHTLQEYRKYFIFWLDFSTSFSFHSFQNENRSVIRLRQKRFLYMFIGKRTKHCFTPRISTLLHILKQFWWLVVYLKLLEFSKTDSRQKLVFNFPIVQWSLTVLFSYLKAAEILFILLCYTSLQPVASFGFIPANWHPSIILTFWPF